ncbi:MAG: Piwi domain-containing protein [Salinivirgaceae bacterium]
MANLTFNLVTFEHPNPELTFYFTDKESELLHRFSKFVVPVEVIEHFGEQDHYYSSLTQPIENGLAITKNCKPVMEQKIVEGVEKTVNIQNSFFKGSLLKRYYNYQIQNFFAGKNLMVKPNFIDDVEVWLPLKSNNTEYNFHDKYTLRIQFATITNQPELLITYAGKSKVFKVTIADLMANISPICYNWVTYKNQLIKFEDLSTEAKRNFDEIFPVWNFDLRSALKQATESPERSNRYIRFKSKIDNFVNHLIKSNEFQSIIKFTMPKWVEVSNIKIGNVSSNSNQLLFGNEQHHIVPINGMKTYGPFDTPPYATTHFFFIYHQDDEVKALKLDSYFKGKEYGFSGLYKFAHLYYYTEHGFSITFANKLNPVPEIETQMRERNFKSEVRYIAVYISAISKDKSDMQQNEIYYKVKELLLKRGITSQVIDASKVLNNPKYYFSLPNIAIAMLAKLDGEPWRLDRTLKSELIVGVGAFRHVNTDVQYIGGAFSFQNNGKFNRFECFRKDQTDELAGSIIRALREYVSSNSEIKRLIIHFYKNMSKKELAPIEQGLKNLGLNIPVFIVTINKTESNDIVAFDNNWKGLMPESGTYINIGYNKFLLFNNTRYSKEAISDFDGYPFPIKITITCSNSELAKDMRTVKELLDQVYQFSRMYWKSVRQQNLPVTIKYPAMVAEMFPHFEGNEIPDFGKDNLWFL